MATTDDTTGSWRQLLGREYAGAMTVLAGGVAVYATNVYLTISLLPSATAEIGGEQLYAWVTTIFLLASVSTSVLVSRLLGLVGGRRAYGIALTAFVLGTVVCTLAPTMPVLLAGRAVQGAGGGLLAGLGYALIRSTLPAALWARGTALTSAMWGVGTFAGPAVGGAFAEFGQWRGAFVAIGVVAVGVGLLVPWALPGGRPDVAREPFPLVSLTLVTLAAVVVSVAGLAGNALLSAAGVVAGLGLLAAVVRHERRTAAGVLPAATFRPGSPLGWIYLTIAVLAVGSTAEAFVPLFGQRLAGLAPLAAGFLAALLALGWTAGEIPSAAASRSRTVRRILVAGPVALAAGLGLAAVAQRSDAGAGTVVLWAAGLLVAGAGVGVAWPHLASIAMGSADDGADGDKASAGINTVQLVANAVGTALSGVLVTLGGTDLATGGQYLFAGFAVLALLGVLTAARAGRDRQQVTGTAGT